MTHNGLSIPKPLPALLRCALIVCAAATVTADTFYVNANDGNDAWNGRCQTWDGGNCGPKQSISAALALATHGDTVLVADGLYTGSDNKFLSFSGYTIELRSENGPENCIINCEGDGGAFIFSNGETAEARLDGFTITGGFMPVGAGIRCDFANPTIANCIITGNSAGGDGGGVSCAGSYPLLLNCRIVNNSAGGSGGGIYGYISGFKLINCTITGNSASDDGGGLYVRTGNPVVLNTTFTENYAAGSGGGAYVEYNGPVFANVSFTGNSAQLGGGIHLQHANAVIINCTFHGNRATIRGGGLLANFYGGSQLHNAILWDNSAPFGPQISVTYWSSLTVSYSHAQGGQDNVHVANDGVLYWDAGNASDDPLFTLPGYWDNNGTPENPNDDAWIEGDYRLLPGSTCIDSGNNDELPSDSLDIDSDGNISELLPLDLAQTPRRTQDLATEDTGVGDPPLVDRGAFEYHADCNGNQILDFLDIADGYSTDLNANTVPDECETMLMLDTGGQCNGDLLLVDLAMAYAQEPIVGGQFFLEFDTTRLALLDIEPGDANRDDPTNPFEREILEFTDHEAGQIDYMVGIADGESGTTNDVVLATAIFQVLVTECTAEDLVAFRANFPTTRLSGELGTPIVPDPVGMPLTTLDLAPPTLSLPPDVDITWCDPSDPIYTGQATATDNCDPNPNVTYEDAVQDDTIFRTWQATDACGNTATAVQAIYVDPCGPVGDINCDCQINATDFLLLLDCLTGPDIPFQEGCAPADLDNDGDVDLLDFALLQRLPTAAAAAR